MAAANPSQSELQSLITSAATSAGIPPSLALAVAQTESNFNPNATNTNSNGTTDCGVMQINSSNLSALGLSNPLDPEANINAGVGLLAQLYNQYGGNVQQTLWAYNAGPGSVTSGSLPSSTASYISTVLANQANYGTTVPDLSDVNPILSAGTDTASFSDDLSNFLASEVSVAGFDVSGAVLIVGGVVLLALLSMAMSRR
jgi:hypothetical protein